MRLLLIEDNMPIAQAIRDYLAHEKIDCDIAKTGQAWLSLLQQGIYDMLLLDLMLPDIDGMTICEDVKKHYHIPIIITSAKSDIDDKAEWFGKGADDYLTKPFDLQELVLRIHAVAKRSQTNDVVQYKDIRIDLTRRQVTQGKQEIALSIKEFHILSYLIRHTGQAVSRTDIIEEVRGGDSIYSHENDGKLDVYIATIRKKLGKELIETIKWFGYSISRDMLS